MIVRDDIRVRKRLIEKPATPKMGKKKRKIDFLDFPKFEKFLWKR